MLLHIAGISIFGGTMFVASRWGSAILLSAVCMLAAYPSIAQNYPNKTIKIVVPNTPGVIPDIVARVMAVEMSKQLGQAIIVENKPGAGQIIGYEFVAKS